jgi:hypothetical protein
MPSCRMACCEERSTGRFRVALEARIDEEICIPLSTKGWVRLAQTDSAALPKAASFLREHKLLGESEDPIDPAVLLRIARCGWQ